MAECWMTFSLSPSARESLEMTTVSLLIHMSDKTTDLGLQIKFDSIEILHICCSTKLVDSCEVWFSSVSCPVRGLSM